MKFAEMADYEGAVGIEEVMKFYFRAGPEEKALFKKLVDVGNNQDAWEVLRKVLQTNLKLQDIKENNNMSPEDLADSIYYRLNRMYPDVVSKYGLEVVGDAILRVADFHAPHTEELGTSDISIMAKEVLKDLESNVNFLGRDEDTESKVKVDEAKASEVKREWERDSQLSSWIQSLKQKAKQGPKKTVWDEKTKTYKVVPVTESEDQIDTVTVDIPLLIRMLEYAREDAKDDMDLHDATERLIAAAKKGTLTMKDYNKIFGAKEMQESDISGLLAASKLNRSFIITAQTAEGQTKKFRVKAQSPNVAKEKFSQHYSMAKILDVKEEGVTESHKIGDEVTVDGKKGYISSRGGDYYDVHFPDTKETKPFHRSKIKKDGAAKITERYDEWDEADVWYIVDTVRNRLQEKSFKHALEREARMQGFSETPDQALRKAGIIRSKFNPNKWVKKDSRTGKWVEVFPYGKPSEQGVTEGGRRFNPDAFDKKRQAALNAANKFGKTQDKATTLHHFAQGMAKDDLSKFAADTKKPVSENSQNDYEQMKASISKVLARLRNQGADDETVGQMKNRIAKHLGYDSSDKLFHNAFMSVYTDATLDDSFNDPSEDDITNYTMQQGELGRKGMREGHKDKFDQGELDFRGDPIKTTPIARKAIAKLVRASVDDRMLANDIRNKKDWDDFMRYQARRGNLKKEQGVAEGDLNEMDKSAPQPGRDGKVSHSTYGSRDKKGSDYFKGKEAPGKPVTAKQANKDALDILKKQGVAEGASGKDFDLVYDGLDLSPEGPDDLRVGVDYSIDSDGVVEILKVVALNTGEDVTDLVKNDKYAMADLTQDAEYDYNEKLDKEAELDYQTRNYDTYMDRKFRESKSSILSGILKRKV